MPWHTERNHEGCPADKPVAVVKDDDGEVEGCHANEDDANAQIAALYADETDMDDDDMASDPVLTAVYDAFADGTANTDAARDPAAYSQGYWRGILAVETVETGDYPRREFADGSLTWRDVPLTIYWQKQTAEGHDNAFAVARADDVWRSTVTLKDGRTVPAIRAMGQYNLVQPEGAEAYQLLLDRFVHGVSVTIDETDPTTDIELIWPEGADTGADEDDDLAMMMMDPEKVIIHHGRVMDACMTGQPALQEAELEPIADADWPAVLAERRDEDGMSPGAVTAAASWDSTVAVAVPADAESLAVAGGLPPEELHVTLGYFGKTADLDPDVLAALKAWADDQDGGFTARVGGVARIGDDDPQATVLLVEAPELADLRASLEQVADPDRTHPHFVPHVTLGYGIDLPADVPADLEIGSVEVWAGEGEGSVTAASAPVLPPVSWFRNPVLPGPTPPTYEDSGRCYGHIALWGVCHTSFSNVCVTPPRAVGADYGHYRKGELVTAEGERVAVGQLTLGANHAPSHLGSAPAADHYDHTGHAVADVAVGEDKWGIWFAGATRPGVDDRTLRMLRAGGLSGDWRKVAGQWKLVASLVVNVPGFPIPRIRTYVSDGEQTALVASGVLRRGAAPSNIVDLRMAAEQIRSTVGRDVASRAAALRRMVHPSTHHPK